MFLTCFHFEFKIRTHFRKFPNTPFTFYVKHNVGLLNMKSFMAFCLEKA